MRALLGRTGAVLLLGATVGVVVNTVRPDGVAWQASPAEAACEAPVELALGPEVMQPQEAARLCADSGVLVADARTAEAFTEGHVAHAVHLPCAADGTVASRVPELIAHKHTVIVYGETTEEAIEVANSLNRRAQDPSLRIVVLAGGFTAWENAGLACSSGPCPSCVEGLTPSGFNAPGAVSPTGHAHDTELR